MLSICHPFFLNCSFLVRFFFIYIQKNPFNLLNFNFPSLPFLWKICHCYIWLYFMLDKRQKNYISIRGTKNIFLYWRNIKKKTGLKTSEFKLYIILFLFYISCLLAFVVYLNNIYFIQNYNTFCMKHLLIIACFYCKERNIMCV